jgi:DNA-binding GntR family transcriptional regulator
VTSAPELVRAGLRRDILNGSLSSGMQLRQDEIAERYGISRIPVREALKQLAVEGLVTLSPHRGAFVTSLSLADVLELQDIRIGLECRALKLAVPEMVESDFERAEHILDRYESEPSIAEWGIMNDAFHRAIYEPCNRPKLLEMIEANFAYVNRYMSLQVSLAAGNKDPNREHRQIVAACRAGDPEKASRLLEVHITHTQKALVAASRKSGSGLR